MGSLPSGFLSGELDLSDFFLLLPGPIRFFGRGDRLCEPLEPMTPDPGPDIVVLGLNVHSYCCRSNSICCGSRSVLLCLFKYWPIVLSVKFLCVSFTSRTEFALSFGSKFKSYNSCVVISFLSWSLCSSYLAAYAYIWSVLF